MQVELVVISDCPNTESATRLLRTALDQVGLADVSFSVEVLDSPEAARTRAFAGSPAFVVDGVDLFESTARPGLLACRLYLTPEGPRNIPTLSHLCQALERRKAGTGSTDA